MVFRVVRSRVMMLDWRQDEKPRRLLRAAQIVAPKNLREDLLGRHDADGLRRSKHVAFACS